MNERTERQQKKDWRRRGWANEMVALLGHGNSFALFKLPSARLLGPQLLTSEMTRTQVTIIIGIGQHTR